MVELVLPWPPSVNTYWRHPARGALAGRHIISVAGRAYRKVVQSITAAQQIGLCVSVPCAIFVDAYPPDRRRRDLDNILKAALDSLVHAAVLADDSLIDELHVLRWAPSAPGRVRILISPKEATQ
jgi:crossover junction endodeoxyribonuclease RusA